MAMSWTAQLLALTFITAGLLLYRIAQGRPHDGIWDTIDTVGVSRRGGRMSWALAILRSVTSMQANMREGYKKFSKAGKPFALPNMWVGGALVVLPPSMLNLLNRPREELSSFEALLENIQFQYLMSDKDVWANTIHFDVVRRNLTQKGMSAMGGVIAEEWDGAFRACWGDSREGKVVNAWDSMVSIIERAALRILVGLPGCRDEKYIELAKLYANAVLVDACFINCMPPVLRPVGGRLLGLRAKYYQHKLLKIVIPMVKERMRECEENGGQCDGPSDAIQWLLPIARENGPEQMAPNKIAMRVLALTPMFVFATGYVFTHAVLDAYCAAPEDNIVDALRAECLRVSTQHRGLSTKEAIDALYTVDSAVRESMRLNDVMVDLLPLDVVSGKGIDLGDGRIIAPGSGVRTVFPAQMVHRDPDIYPDPDRFDAFRFSREFKSSQQEAEPRPASTRQLMTTVTKTFLPFGYGRHTCPGRWLVAYMVKQALSHVLLNYDVEIIKRPGERASILNMMAPQNAEMLVTLKRQDR
ncbi:hypothetical protein QQS21_007175 [Conoideocrella luteorostrata]|uniref:Cytochrome P450 n=1 Tax=Conoideocrella luteorostrata TaxID=1105319 RepID=A0AAJ0CLJ6_9HYPO|nr:hypothetical protein QQS21_007175 [Conoideocrella luteorostrata]